MWVKCVSRTRIRVGKPASGFYESLKSIYSSKINAVKRQKYLDISLTVIKYHENTFIRYTYDLGLKIPFSNWVKCVTRTSDRKSALGRKITEMLI